MLVLANERLFTKANFQRDEGLKTANSGTIVIYYICWRKPVFSAMTWAKRLKRGCDINIETYNECGGDVRIIVSIEDSVVIRKILVHLDNNATSAAVLLPDCRTSPAVGLLV